MAQVDYFLKIDGVDGESTDDKHKGEIEVESWSMGGTNAGTFSSGGGAGCRQGRPQDFHFVKKVDKSSAVLFIVLHRAAPEDRDLVCRKAGKDQQEFLKIVHVQSHRQLVTRAAARPARTSFRWTRSA